MVIFGLGLLTAGPPSSLAIMVWISEATFARIPLESGGYFA